MTDPLLIAKGDNPLYLLPGMSNRHGLVAGATGTGKTVTLQVMAESFSRVGVPVFAADVKGDLSGISQPGSDNLKVQDRIKKLGLTDFSFNGSPVTFWDVFGRARPSRPRHHFRDGTAAHQPHPEPERHPVRCHGAGVQDCR
jgi:DNA helicase HerA-like ATPase